VRKIYKSSFYIKELNFLFFKVGLRGCKIKFRFSFSFKIIIKNNFFFVSSLMMNLKLFWPQKLLYLIAKNYRLRFSVWLVERKIFLGFWFTSF
jgi:hypothetical protein